MLGGTKANGKNLLADCLFKTKMVVYKVEIRRLERVNYLAILVVRYYFTIVAFKNRVRRKPMTCKQLPCLGVQATIVRPVFEVEPFTQIGILSVVSLASIIYQCVSKLTMYLVLHLSVHDKEIEAISS